jgi:hypothetical protein
MFVLTSLSRIQIRKLTSCQAKLASETGKKCYGMVYKFWIHLWFLVWSIGHTCGLVDDRFPVVSYRLSIYRLEICDRKWNIYFNDWSSNQGLMLWRDIANTKGPLTLNDWWSPVTKGGTQKLPKRFQIVETYRHDHSLESSCGALSDGTIFEKVHFKNFFSQKPQTLIVYGEVLLSCR